MDFGQKLKILRKRLGLTLDELGDKIGYSNPYISQIETGEKIPSIPFLKAIAPFMGVSLVMLMLDLGYLDEGDVTVTNKHYSINDFVHEAHQNAINKGWYEDPKSFGDMIALMHSELSEALEDHRNGHGFRETYYEGNKPCGIPTELADAVIRIFDTCGYLGIDLESAIRAKMAYNFTRPLRHGGKRL